MPFITTHDDCVFIFRAGDEQSIACAMTLSQVESESGRNKLLQKRRQASSDSRAGGAAPSKIKGIVPWYSTKKSRSSNWVQLTGQITRLAHSHKAGPRSSWKVTSTGQE